MGFWAAVNHAGEAYSLAFVADVNVSVSTEQGSPAPAGPARSSSRFDSSFIMRLC